MMKMNCERCGTRYTSGERHGCLAITPEADAINPSHYRSHLSGVEAITICEHETFCVGNAVKYIFRRNLKGSPIEDLKKAIWYLTREIARLEKGDVK